MRSISCLLTTLSCCFSLIACGGELTDPTLTVASVEVTPADTTLLLGESVQLTAIARDANGNAVTGSSFQWSSSNENVCTVGWTGRASTVCPGEASITVGVGGRSAQAVLTVRPRIHLDGRLCPGEWDGALEIPFEINLPNDSTGPGVLYMTDDTTRVYVGARFKHSEEFALTYLVVLFDNDNDGIHERQNTLTPAEEGDDYFSLLGLGTGGRFSGASSFFDGFQTLRTNDPRGVVGLSDLDDPDGYSGTSDGEVVFQVTDGYAVYEAWHPLDSADDLHDFSLQAGQTVGFSFYVNAWSASWDLTQTNVHDDWSFFHYTIR